MFATPASHWHALRAPVRRHSPAGFVQLRSVDPPFARAGARLRHAWIVAALAWTGATMPASAIELTWDGAVGAPEWNALGFIRGEDGIRKLVSNWSSVNVPANGDSLVFAGTNTLVNANTDAALSTIAGLSFAENAGAFTMFGTDLLLNGNLGNRSSARQTINFGLAVGGPTGIWDGGAGGIAINGKVDLRGNSLTLVRNIAVDNAGVDHVMDGPGARLRIDGGSSYSARKTALSSGASAVVTGTGSRWVTGSLLDVFLGSTVDIVAGANASAESVQVRGFGIDPDGVSKLRVDGAGTTLDVRDTLSLAASGNSDMRVTGGAAVRSLFARFSTSPAATNSVEISGPASSWTVAQNLTVGFDNGSGGSSLVRVLVGQGGLLSTGAASLFGDGDVDITVRDTGSVWRNGSGLLIGVFGDGPFIITGTNVLTIDAGGRVETGSLQILKRGRLDLLNGTLRITGPGGVVLGTRGLDRPFTLEAGQVLEVANGLEVSTGGRLTLSGGRVSARSFSFTGGAFTWTGGTLDFTADEDFVVGTTALSRALLVPEGGRLQVARNVVVGNGRWLLLDGELAARGIELAGGTVSSTGVLDLDLAGDLRGHGLVAGGIAGGAGKKIVAQGGTLTLGDADRTDGFRFGGTLDTGSDHVVVLSAGRALLGPSTQIGPGGRLSTVNGATLAGGGELTFSGSATVFGDFTNDGQVRRAAGADLASTLTFRNDVDGAGSFDGAVVFRSTYRPGNSPATISFHGEDATFDPTSVLTIELLGDAPGTQYDQLVDIGLLTFHGRLHLVFEGGYAPATGTTFDLLDFARFTGSLAPDRIDVTGFDRTRLDVSKLATTGELSVAPPIPEPETWALFALGAGFLGWRLRWAGGAARMHADSRDTTEFH